MEPPSRHARRQIENGALSALPARPRDRRAVLVLAIASVVIFAAIAPFARVPLVQYPAFIPIYQAALVLIDLVTAALLLAQFHVWRSRPLLVLACGYVFTASITVAHTLTFPGLFSPAGLLGAGEQSTAWIYMFWHAAFPAFVIAYACVPDRTMSERATGVAVAGAVALAAVFAALATAGHRFLPPIMSGHGYLPGYHFIVAVVWLCSIGALAALWRRRHRSVLDVWMMAVMCTWIFEVALAAVLNAGRFDLGFYAGRAYGLVAASIVLVVLMFEAATLHARVADAARDRVALAEAEAASRAKDQFLAMLGHELRNPLAAVMSTLQIMRLRSPDTMVLERGVLERQSAQLRRMVDDLLDVSRFARGDLHIEKTVCEVSDLVARAREMAGQPLAQHDPPLVVDVPSGLKVEADADRFAQAICNLLTNAVKFTPPGSRISLVARRLDGLIEIVVGDEGAGFEPAVAESLFTPFMQEQQAMHRPQGGLGLGLTIVRHLVALHGGTVEARSQGRGHGASFVIRVPSARVPQPQGSEAPR